VSLSSDKDVPISADIYRKTDRIGHHVALIGYARVSTADQKLSLQLDALNTAGCDRIFDDHASGAKADRPGLTEALAYLRPGDTLVVWKLDRLGRSMSHLIEKVGELAARGIGFRSLTENIDTTTSGGMLVFNIFGSLAQFERDLIRERTHAGLKAARERGKRVVAGLSLPPTNYVKRGRISQRASLFVRRRPGSRSAKPPYTRLWKTRETAGDQELVGAGHRGFDRFGQSVRPPLGGIVPGQAPDCWTKARQLAGATDRN
tara:strand:+ start:145 stop:927 length:783 start_codon:yes stop_codon:yes gene_type:complete